MNPASPPSDSPLGKTTGYSDHYDPGLLFPIARADKRAELGITGSLPFFGMDVWNAYEVSWLNLRGEGERASAAWVRRRRQHQAQPPAECRREGALKRHCSFAACQLLSFVATKRR